MGTIKELFLIALTIVIIAGAATYFGDGTITGQVVNKLTTIEVSPTEISQDNREITVTVIPGSNGADSNIEIIKYSGSKEIEGAPGTKVYTKRYCFGSSICKSSGSVKWIMGSEDSGQYYAAVRDCGGKEVYNCRMDGKYVKSFFTVAISKQAEERPRLITNIIMGE